MAHKNLSKRLVATGTTYAENTKPGKDTSMIKAIIFDLDGTLVDSKKAYLEAARIAFSAIGQHLVDFKLATEIPKRLEQNLPMNDLVDEQLIDKFLEIYLKTYYDVTSAKSEPFPGIAEALKRLSKITKMALTTRRNVSKQEIVNELKKKGLAQYFQEVLTARSAVNPKPSPDALLKTARQLRVRLCECLTVGDSVVDIRAGRRAGCKTAAVLSGIFSRNELKKEKPDFILENASKLPDFLEKLRK